MVLQAQCIHRSIGHELFRYLHFPHSTVDDEKPKERLVKKPSSNELADSLPYATKTPKRPLTSAIGMRKIYSGKCNEKIDSKKRTLVS